MRRQQLVIMVKEPHPGRVKTRLGRDLGMTTSAWWFRHQSARLIRRLRDPRWELILAVAPDVEGLTSRVWPSDLLRIPQGQGDIGDRMGRILRHMPPGPVCIVGADIPDITRAHIHQAFQSLGSHESTFGPAADGGFWLVGMKRSAPPPHRLFQGVRWSTQYALADTIATLPDHRIAKVATLSDVDTAEDLPSLRVGPGSDLTA